MNGKANGDAAEVYVFQNAWLKSVVLAKCYLIYETYSVIEVFLFSYFLFVLEGCTSHM